MKTYSGRSSRLKIEKETPAVFCFFSPLSSVMNLTRPHKPGKGYGNREPSRSQAIGEILCFDAASCRVCL